MPASLYSERLNPVSAIDVLIAVLENPTEIPGIRFQAGVALRQIGEPAVAALIAAFESGDASTQDIAASALGGGNRGPPGARSSN